jgi:alkaline phosphatase D
MRRKFLAILVCAAWSACPASSFGAGDNKPLSRIAFGSCVHQDRPQPIWERIVAAKPELFLMLGDNIYADTEDMTQMRRMYAQLAAQPGYKKLRGACPILATWDDHDFGANDAGAEYPKKKESQQLFLDFFGVPKVSPRRKQEGVYSAHVFGPKGKRVQIILLDTRYHRSPLKKDPKLPRNKGQYVGNDDPNATILGAAQWKWLEAQLKVPAQVRLLCSSIQLVAEDHGFEKWMNFPRERQRLFRLIRDTKAAGVIVLSGDRHLGELSVMNAGIGYSLYDLTSSGLNMGNQRWRQLEPSRHRVAILDRGNNFGVVRIDWDNADPLIRLEIHDSDGEVVIRHKVPLSRLRPRGKADEPAGLGAEAMKRVGKPWTVEFTVRATGSSRGKKLVFLNSDRDFRSAANLAVVLDLAALKKDLEAAKISDPARHYAGKKIKVSGTASLFNKRPQIMVKQLKQIEIVE